jgi:EAL domain-containing protein (putative c-di-GMP-specific phosphodiesterase class I)
VDDVVRALATTGLPAGLLQLEVTESAFLGPGGRAAQALDALAEIGARIAVDDFGTGYSNLAYLPRLPLHSLKLARVLVEDPPGSTEQPFVTHLIALAHALGLHVTAEGVETADQAARLRAGGCDTAQGWLFGRPATWQCASARLQRELLTSRR